MANWSDLLPEMLSCIAKEIHYFEDFLNFEGVCQSWKSAVTEDEKFIQPPSPLISRFPCLMLAESKTTTEEEEYHRGFFHLSNGGVIRKVKLPEAHKQRCVSTRGWLLVVGEDEFEAKLVHPLSRTQIDLPSLSTLPDYDIENDACRYRHCMRKVVFTSSDPRCCDSSSFYVFVIWGSSGMLGFCRLGDESWTDVSSGWKGRIYDINYHNGRERVYAINIRGIIKECEIHNHNDSSRKQEASATLRDVTEIPRKFYDYWYFDWFQSGYLLEWDDDKLLVVSRKTEYEDEEIRDLYKTLEFHVFVVDLKTGEWSKLESLGSRAVFLGFNSSFYINAASSSDDDDEDEDGYCTIKGNCIYFADDCYEFYLGTPEGGGRDIGVYHMSDGTIKPLLHQESLSPVSPPLWLEPSSHVPVQSSE